MLFHMLFMASSAPALPGIAWGQLILVTATIVTALVAIGGFIDMRIKRRQDETKGEIKEAVEHLSTVLLERLETKENVSHLRTEIAVLGERMRKIEVGVTTNAQGN